MSYWFDRSISVFQFSKIMLVTSGIVLQGNMRKRLALLLLLDNDVTGRQPIAVERNDPTFYVVTLGSI